MLLNDNEYTVAALMADLPSQRAASHALTMQIYWLAAGLTHGWNPVSRSRPSEKTIVGEGDTLQIVAIRLWGSPDGWADLARENNIQYPYGVVAGQVLNIPDR
jgi:hypothetical protein